MAAAKAMKDVRVAIAQAVIAQVLTTHQTQSVAVHVTHQVHRAGIMVPVRSVVSS